MKIEHWQSRSCYPCKQLDYSNLLGACLGGDRERKSPRFHHCDTYKGKKDLHHCDTYKGKKDLRWNPADPTHRIETRLRYEADGSIRSDDPTFDAQLCQVLNLNLAQLKNNRKGVLDAVLEWWRHEKAKVQDRSHDQDLCGNVLGGYPRRGTSSRTAKSPSGGWISA